MGSFDASLRTIGNRRGLPATLTIENGRLMIEAGDHTIGNWALDEIQLEQTPSGYRLAAEGEQLLIDLPNVEEFDMALRGKRVRGQKAAKGRTSSESETKSTTQDEPGVQVSAMAAPVKATEATVEPRQPRHSRRAEAGRGSEAEPKLGFMGILDRALDTAHQKWGGLFPTWMFTRGTAYVVAAVLVLLLVLPHIVFYAFLLAGFLLVMLGAVLYTDSVLSARWLPGRMTPMHVLISGIGSLLLGVVIAMAARNVIYVIVLGVVMVAGIYLAMTAATRNASG